jgi:hypothetical protein
MRRATVRNLAYFGIEFTVALTIGSVSLFADSIDFLEDASINFLILVTATTAAASRARRFCRLVTTRWLTLLLSPLGWCGLSLAISLARLNRRPGDRSDERRRRARGFGGGTRRASRRCISRIRPTKTAYRTWT